MKFYRIGENNKKNAMAKYIYSLDLDIFSIFPLKTAAVYGTNFRSSR